MEKPFNSQRPYLFEVSSKQAGNEVKKSDTLTVEKMFIFF